MKLSNYLVLDEQTFDKNNIAKNQFLIPQLTGMHLL